MAARKKEVTRAGACQLRAGYTPKAFADQKVCESFFICDDV